MSKNAWQEAADDAVAMGARPRQGRASSVVIGLLLVGTLTFAGAYYVPMHRAHATLTAAHQDLSEKAQAIHEELQDHQKQLAEVKQERDGFVAEATQRKNAEAQRQSSLDRKQQTLASALEKYVGRGYIKLETAPGKLALSFKANLVQTPHSVDVSRAGTGILCQIGKTLGAGEKLEIHAYVQEKNGSPRLAKDYPSPWALSAARAASVSKTLQESCGVDGKAVVAVAHGRFSDDATLAKDADVLLLTFVP